MDYIDYYKVLGVEKTATQKEIRDAYRKLARTCHPDLNPNDKDAMSKFQRINEANEVLSDPDKRKKYDQYGKDWQHSEAFEQQRQEQRQWTNAGGASFTSSQNEGDFSDFFEFMFGGGARPQSKRRATYRGEDYSAEIRLNLLDAYQTHTQTLTVNKKNIRITIPAGVENGQVVKIAGHGGPGVNGGPNGDLYITFVVANHPRFKRLGSDLYTTVKLDLYVAVLGGDIIIDTLSGKVKLTVNPGTQNGCKIKLKGKGFPVYKSNGEFGDLYITYSVNIPTNLTEKQKVLFAQLSKMQS